MTGLLDVTLQVVAALDACRIPYTVGGSLASSFSGEPRASIDADILVEMTSAEVEPLINLLGAEFYADADALRRAVAEHGTTNLIHRPTGVKIDLFIAHSFLDARQLERRRHVRIATNPDRFLYVHSPEDILLQKLHWYRLGGEVSDRQWRDVLGLLVKQGHRLDRDYLAATATRADLTDLLERAYRETDDR
ncbi:MAG TPA: hypothetical protein VF424_08340 [Vicinamibacterales bacterium]